MQLTTTQHHEYCLACSDPLDDVGGPVNTAPLVPVTWPAKRIWQVKSVFEKYQRAIQDVEPEDFPIPKGRAPRFPIPVIDDLIKNHGLTKTRAGGRPTKLTLKDLHDLKRLVERRADASLAAITRVINARKADKDKVHTHTVRRAIQKHGLKKPARRS